MTTQQSVQTIREELESAKRHPDQLARWALLYGDALLDLASADASAHDASDVPQRAIALARLTLLVSP